MPGRSVATTVTLLAFVVACSSPAPTSPEASVSSPTVACRGVTASVVSTAFGASASGPNPAPAEDSCGFTLADSAGQRAGSVEVRHHAYRWDLDAERRAHLDGRTIPGVGHGAFWWSGGTLGILIAVRDGETIEIRVYDLTNGATDVAIAAAGIARAALSSG